MKDSLWNGLKLTFKLAQRIHYSMILWDFWRGWVQVILNVNVKYTKIYLMDFWILISPFPNAKLLSKILFLSLGKWLKIDIFFLTFFNIVQPWKTKNILSLTNTSLFNVHWLVNRIYVLNFSMNVHWIKCEKEIWRNSWFLEKRSNTWQKLKKNILFIIYIYMDDMLEIF